MKQEIAIASWARYIEANEEEFERQLYSFDLWFDLHIEEESRRFDGDQTCSKSCHSHHGSRQGHQA